MVRARLEARVATSTSRNLRANYVNLVVVTVVGFVLNPILLFHLGSVGFGVWRTVQRAMDVAVAADGQAYQAVKWVIASQHNTATGKEQRAAVGSAVMAWVLWLPVLVITILTFAWAMPALTGAESSQWSGVARDATLILGAGLLLGGVLLIPDAALIGVGQGYRSMSVNALMFALTAATTSIAVMHGAGVRVVAAIVVSGALVNASITWKVAERAIEWWGWERPSRDRLVHILTFGSWTQVWSLATRLLLAADVLVVGTLMGATAVTDYAFTAYITVAAAAVCVLTTSAFAPQISHAMSEGRSLEASRLILASRRLTVGVASFVGVTVIYFNELFLAAWIGPGHYLGDLPNLLIVLSFLQVSSMRSEGQLQDISLNVKIKALVGVLAALLGPACAWGFYEAFSSVESILWGLIVGRLVGWLYFPRLVSQMVPTLAWPVPLHVFSVVLVVGAYACVTLLSVEFPTAAPSWGLFALLAGGVAYKGLLAVSGRQ